MRSRKQRARKNRERLRQKWLAQHSPKWNEGDDMFINANRDARLTRLYEVWSQGGIVEGCMTADQLNVALGECDETDNEGSVMSKETVSGLTAADEARAKFEMER